MEGLHEAWMGLKGLQFIRPAEKARMLTLVRWESSGPGAEQARSESVSTGLYPIKNPSVMKRRS